MKIEHHLKNLYPHPAPAEQAARDAKGTDTQHAVEREGQSADKRRKRERDAGKSKLQVERIVEEAEQPGVLSNKPVSKPGLNIIV